MPAELPEEARRLIDEPNLAHFVTLMKDGSPQVTPLWVDRDGDIILVNTAEGRQKVLNLRRDPRVALSIVDPRRTQLYVQIRGRVTELISGDEARAHFGRVATKYTGRPFSGAPAESRVLLKIVPEHVQVSA
jgi:PPOX class probable F420-dependent enzyme